MSSADTGVLSVSDRDRILQAMAECCSELGYGETTAEAVIERAGVEPESFESHFADLEECALAAFNKLVSETLTRISTAHPLAADEIGRRKFEVKAIVELMTAQPAFAWLGFIEARQGGTPRMHDAYESGARVLALMMERAGDPNGSRSGLARAALGGAEALVRRELAAGRGARLPALLEDFVYAALVPFVGQREALRQAKQAARVAAEEG